jgi:phosphoribosylglycinamide formyltransferase 1
MRRRIAVLASGAGTNLQAILDHLARLGERRPGDVALVASDVADAGALGRARAAGIPAEAFDRRDAAALERLLCAREIEIVALAGYLRPVPDGVTRRYLGRIVNVHPALLPAFGGAGMFGRRVHEAVLAAGVRLTGVTVHFVDAAYDHGPIIAQWPVPVLPTDTPELLQARVLRAEHRVYPRVIEAVCTGAVTLGEDGRVVGGVGPSHDSEFALQPVDQG